jgi:hypothetical protein
LKLALSKGPNRVRVSPHLRMETDSVSETCFLSLNYLESGRWTKSKNPLILCELFCVREHPFFNCNSVFVYLSYVLEQCFSIGGPWPGIGLWHQLYLAAGVSPRICRVSFLSIFHDKYFIVEIF